MQNIFLITITTFLLSLVASPVANAQPDGSSGRIINAGDLLRVTIVESPDLDGTYPVGGDG